MSMIATVRPRPRRKPKLRVIGGVWRPRRRIITFGGMNGYRVLIEVWTDAEWELLAEGERPDDARRLPTIGWYHEQLVNEVEAARVGLANAELQEANPDWY